MDNKKKTLAIVFGIFVLVIVTTAASFAFFTYSRVGNTKATIISGDIEFSYIEGDSAELINAFPVDDEIGAVDTTGEYTFEVKLKSSSATTANYNVYLVDNNTSTNHFTNEQIKFALIKNDVFVANTSATSGLKLSTLDGFNEGVSTGEGLVLEDQEISSGDTDKYKLRIWISDDVSYNNTYETDGTMTGKYNSYTYSLKVKVTSGVDNSTTQISELKSNRSLITAELNDPAGLAAYAITNSNSTPSDSEWIEITSDTAKSNVVRTATDKVTSKTISYRVPETGTYYLHVKNKLNEVKTKKVEVIIEEIKPVSGSAAEYIMNLAKTNTDELRIDKHSVTEQTDPTTEYRYWGASPKNYVEFNGEPWRIIGVFDVDDGTGKIEKRVKIIRDESIGNLPWDESTYNSGYGINEWSQADLKILLNEGDYYNRLNTYSTIGLTNEAKEMIGDAMWYLGSHVSNVRTASIFYGVERGRMIGKQCTQGTAYCDDTVERTTSWVGEVGLMYPSDYGYAANMTSCSAINLSRYNDSCATTDWIFKNGIGQWTMMPHSPSSHANVVFHIDSTGFLNGSAANYASNTHGVFPTTYLSSDIKIVDGTGESGENAYKLSK